MAGETVEKAIVVMADDEITGVTMEYMHIESERCDCGGRWETVEQALLEFEGRFYDQIHVRCQDCGSERNFYFDITSFFGRH